jgi:hypothetical protein
MKTLRSYLAFLSALVIPVAAGACTCVPPTASRSLKIAHIAFRGELIEHKDSLAIFRVDEWWKGDLGGTVQFEWRDGTHGDCNGFWPNLLKVGNKLLVFGTQDNRGFYRASICLPAKLIGEADEELKELGPGKPPRKDRVAVSLARGTTQVHPCCEKGGPGFLDFISFGLDNKKFFFRF